MKPIERAVKKAGGQKALADAIGVSPQRLWYWVSRGKKVPPECCRAIEEATGVKRHQLRPDVFDKVSA